MAVVAVLIIFVTILWIYFLWSRRKYYMFALKMPGPIGLPIFGIVHRLAKIDDLLDEIPKLATQYNVKTCFTWLGPYPTLYTKDPKVAEIILSSPDCINKARLYEVFTQIIGNSLLSIKTPIWNNHRRLLNPLFSHKVLLGFFPIFNKLTDELCAKLEKHVDCGEVNVKDVVFVTTMDTSINTIFGKNFDPKCRAEFLKNWERMTELSAERIVRPWYWKGTLYRFSNMYKPFMEAKFGAMNFIRELIHDKIQVIKNQENNNKPESAEIAVGTGKPKTKIFIDQAIKIHLRNEFTVEDLAAESALMIFASYDTTATTLFSTLMFLAMHPQYQERAYEEILSVFPNEDFDVDCEDFKNLVYVDMCIQETQRLVTVIPLMARSTINDVPLSEGLVIPKGTEIIIDAYNIHRDESIWGQNVGSYDPDHFLPANVTARHSYSFLPFSKGQRKCLGWQYSLMSLKVGLSKILRKYRFSTTYRFEDLKFIENVTIKFDIYPHLEVHRR